MGRVVTTLFDEVHTDILAGLRSGETLMHREAPDAKRVVVSYTTTRMPPERAGQFRNALLAVVEEFQAAAVPGEPRFELRVAIAPRSRAVPATCCSCRKGLRWT